MTVRVKSTEREKQHISWYADGPLDTAQDYTENKISCTSKNDVHLCTGSHVVNRLPHLTHAPDLRGQRLVLVGLRAQSGVQQRHRRVVLLLELVDRRLRAEVACGRSGRIAEERFMSRDVAIQQTTVGIGGLRDYVPLSKSHTIVWKLADSLQEHCPLPQPRS
jgi:hypothetical protein